MPIPRTPEQNKVLALLTGADENFAVAKLLEKHQEGLYCTSVGYNCYQATKRYAKAALIATGLSEVSGYEISLILISLETGGVFSFTSHELAEAAVLDEFGLEWSNDIEKAASFFEANDLLGLARNFRNKLRPLANDFLLR